MRIAYLTQLSNDYIVSAFSRIGKVWLYYSLDKLNLKEEEYDAIIISADLGKDIIKNVIKECRSMDSSLFVVPIFVEKNGELMKDGVSVLLSEIADKINKIKALYSEIEQYSYSKWENKVLAYCYTRPAVNLIPHAEEQNPMFYQYSLIEQFYDGQEDYFYWLEEMARQNILTKVKVVDRLFCCTFCFSALMKFSDHCPACGSINIRNEKFIHCFTCGHVAPESNFVKNGRFVCPSCKSNLKLLGEDYDRPLENGVCMDCGNYHIDSKLMVNCLTCKKTFTTEELSKRTVYEYALTEAGRNQVRFGNINSVYMIVNELNYIALSHFNFMLDWSISMQKRYKEECFGMMALKIVLNENASSYDLILEFSKFLRSSFRATDLCSKTDNSTFVFVFPKTDSIGLNQIKERLDGFFKTIELRKGKFEIVSSYYTSEGEDLSEQTAQKLTLQLTAGL